MDFSRIQSLTIPEGVVTKIMCGSLVLWELVTGRLPSIYQEVEWIGNQAAVNGINGWLKLGFSFDTKARIEMGQYVVEASSGYIFGAAENSGKLRCMLLSPNSSNANFLFYGSKGSAYISVQPDLKHNAFNEFIFTLEPGKLYAYNRTTNSERSLKTQGTVVMTNELHLFGQNYNGSNRIAGVNRIGYFRYYDKNDELICDLVPCYRKSDGVIGMYDLARKTFLTSASEFGFEKGSDVVEKVNKWNLLKRTEFMGNVGDSTYYFDPTGQYQSVNKTMPLSEDIWWNGGRHLNNGVYYSKQFCDSYHASSTLSDITEDSFTITAGTNTGATDTFVGFPFHLNANETIKITHTRNGHNRSGYQIFNTDGTFRSYEQENLTNGPGAIDVTEFTATDECWFVWLCGRYDPNTSVTISNINVEIK